MCVFMAAMTEAAWSCWLTVKPKVLSTSIDWMHPEIRYLPNRNDGNLIGTVVLPENA